MKIFITAVMLALGAAACNSASRPAPATDTAPAQMNSIISRDESELLGLGYQLLSRLYLRSDFVKIAQTSEELLSVNPGDAMLTYSVAVNHSRTGNKAKSLEWLGRLAELKSDLVPSDDEFSQIESPEYRSAKALIVAAAPVFKPAGVTFRLADRELIPEGIAHDPVDRVFYIGSRHSRKVIAVDSSGSATDFSAPSDGLYSVLGLRVDPERRLLWVATSAAEGFDVNEFGRAALHKYDLETRKLIESYKLGNNPRHVLNDIALGWDGEVYVTDSSSGAVYATVKASNRLVEVARQGTFAYPNGIVASPVKGKLFVADFGFGLSVLDLANGRATRMLHPTGLNYHAIDGLYYADGSLIGIQNGAGLGRIVRLGLNARADTVTSFEVLHANDPLFDVPTTAAINGSVIHVIANSQLRRIAPDGRLLSPETLQETAVVEIPMARRGR